MEIGKSVKIKRRNQDGVIGYMCGVDWEHHLGEDARGTTIFPCVETLQANKKCWKSCGIVQIKVFLNTWVKEQNLE